MLPDTMSAITAVKHLEARKALISAIPLNRAKANVEKEFHVTQSPHGIGTPLKIIKQLKLHPRNIIVWMKIRVKLCPPVR